MSDELQTLAYFSVGFIIAGVVVLLLWLGWLLFFAEKFDKWKAERALRKAAPDRVRKSNPFSDPLMNQSLRPRETRFKPNNCGNLKDKLADNGHLMR